MMKTIRVAEASNIQLDWLVGRAGGGGKLPIWQWIDGRSLRGMFCYTTNWSQMGPIIERERLTTQTDQHDTEGPMWTAYKREFLFAEDGTDCWSVGTTPLIAAARCYIMSKLGEVVEVPEELE